jgi:Domain of unknown function (DUF4115)
MNALWRTLGDVAFWLASALGVALLGLLVLASAGVVPVEPAKRADATPTRTGASRGTRPAPVEPEPSSRTAPVAAQTVDVTVTAARGESWIAARLGSASGRLLEERLLPQGETARFTGRRVWLLVGASANVDVVVDGEPRALSPGTVETVFAPPVR